MIETLLSKLKKKKPETTPIKVGTGEFTPVTSKYLRPNSSIEKQDINLVYHYAGIGDYIYWTTVMEWIIKEHTHLVGTVMAPRFFYELAKHWLAPYADRFTVKSYKRLEDDKFYNREDKLFIVPDRHQMANSCGFHLLNIGFAYYANIDQVPEGYMRLPIINGDEAPLTHLRLPENYVVVTTEATSPIRKLKGKTVNEITSYLIKKGITPVFLGKRELAHDYEAESDETIETKGVIDLREKTSLLEAAVILAKARAVAGLDNGLLHLACCSRVPVVFGFNTVDPRHRAPPRREGAKTIAVAPPPELNCRFCQSNVRFALGHNFHKCLYKDNKCLDYLNGKTFIKALDKLLFPATL